MKRIKYCLFLVGILISLFSCRDEYSICTQGKEIRMKADFFEAPTGVDIPKNAPSLSVTLLNGSTAIYSNQSNVNSFFLSLNPLVSSSKYVISVGNNLQSDTVTINYTTLSTIISAECGNANFNTISTIQTTLHTIDSVKITNSLVTNSPIQNAKIYF
jgi:Family of unknown function (DUF6452)